MSAERTSPIVHVIGVSGCSAAGKSTFAHDLALALRSPFYPISLDHFFDAAICEALGTYEDCRTLKLDVFAAAITELIAIVRTEVPSAWREAVAARAPALSSYVVPTAATQTSESAEPAVAQHHTNDRHAHSGTSSEDASLCAHEAEDSARRTERTVGTSGGTLTTTVAYADDTVYVVCEGFLLFADLDMTASLFDAMLEVTAPSETACWRRFNRLPRRKHPHMDVSRQRRDGVASVRTRGVYERRIRDMWQTRTEPRRRALSDDLDKRFSATRAIELGWGHACSDQLDPARSSEAESSVVRVVRDWVSPAHFFPPCQMAADSSAPQTGAERDAPTHTREDEGMPLWDAETGEPTDLFIKIMLGNTVSASPSRVTAPPLPQDGTVLSAEEWYVRRQALLPQSVPIAETLASTSAASSLRERQYAEFRYWFVHEVLYYYTLYQPLQRLHMRLCCRHRPTTFCACVVNGETTTRHELRDVATAMATQLRHHWSHSTCD